jgi:hypothetical protein
MMRCCAPAGRAGLVNVTWQGLTGGIVTLHEGTVPPR